MGGILSTVNNSLILLRENLLSSFSNFIGMPFAI